ncbi:hypothetical protein [Thalassolituus sp.]|uniref:hypothetical protein n=1 Tax=Thalassolituus sp. TaxID=2030822 RepID=UPI0035186DDA
MMEYEFTDPQGNRFCFRKGFGPKVYHPENLCSGTPYSAELILNRFDDQVIDSGFDHFYFDVLSRLPNYSPQRRITMARALADNHLILEKLKSLPEVVPDNRSILRVQIRNALRSIVEDEKREAAMHQRQMDKESTLMKGLIYTGAFMTGIGSSAWGLAVQAKEISDVINPFVKMQHHATALRTAWESDDFADTYTETYLSGEKRELVEAIGFDPSQITQQQIDEAIAMADLVLNDNSIRDILYGFVKDYAEAQHAIEITRVAGSGAFELILTIIVAAVTGGAGVVAAVGSKMHLVRKFKGVGEHLVEFAKASRSIKKAKKESQGQNTGPGKFESEAGSAKQTNPHGAETGEPSSKETSGLHNQQLKVEVKRGSFKTTREVDMDNLSESEAAAYDAMKNQGWSDDKIAEVLSSGDNFRIKELKAGDKLYGFGTQGYSKDISTSAYWMDEKGFSDMKSQYLKDGEWDRESVKNSMALPCFNRANSIDIAEVTETHMVVESDIGVAREILQYSNDQGYSTGFTGKIMPGGGTQIAPNPSMLTPLR